MPACLSPRRHRDLLDQFAGSGVVPAGEGWMRMDAPGLLTIKELCIYSLRSIGHNSRTR